MNTSLENKIAELEARIIKLEAKLNLVSPPISIPWGDTIPTICSECGMNWEGTMGYCCPNIKCPMGAGPTICG